MSVAKKVWVVVRVPIALNLVFLVCSGIAYSQNNSLKDSLNISNPLPDNKINLHQFILPASLITIGAFANNDNDLINNYAIKAERDENYPHFQTSVDDYLQFAPIVAGYGFAFTSQPKNLWTYTKQVVFTEIIICVSVPPIKKLSKVPRPDTGAYNAFPSGHTSQAFASATLFADNFAQHKPLLKILAYTSASAVGVLRVMNNRHWTSDVIAGAGFGIISAKVSELVFKEKPKSHHNHYALQ